MLPKVANQLIHHTSRAVAAVQNQTGHTIRNVLHIQSSTPTTVANRNGPGSSSSGRGGNGTGAGGARPSGSSRFHNSYSALSRSVTQADPSLLHSVTVEAADEGDEVVNATPSAVASRRLRQRARRSSSALSVYDRDSLQKSGLLYALQQHARATHAFATPPASARVAESSPKDAEQATANTEDAGVSARDDKEEQLIASLRNARLSGDHSQVLSLAQDIRQSESPCSASVYNAALDALYRTRPSGEAPVALLELYNDMVARSVLPNGATYTILISALSDRDLEVVSQTLQIREQARRLLHVKRYREELRKQDESRLSKLRQENNLPSALILFQAGCLLRNYSFSRNVYTTLLRSCAAAGNVDAALRVFSHLEKRLTPGILAYRYLLEAHSKSGDLAGAKEVFSAYLEIAKAGHVYLDPQSSEQVWRVNHVAVYNEMIRSYIYHNQASEALGILEQMLGPDAQPDGQLSQVPSPSPSTFTGIINGFIRTGDLDSALTWFNRLLQEPLHPQDPLVPAPRPTKPTATAWKSMINALAYGERAEDLQQVIAAASRDNAYTLDNSDRFAYVYTILRHFEQPDKLDRAALDQLFETHVKALDPYEMDILNGVPQNVSFDIVGVYLTLMKLYMALGDHERAIGSLEYFAQLVLKDSLAGEQAGTLGSDIVMHRKKLLRILLVSAGANYWFGPDRPLSYSMRLGSLCYDLDILPRDPVAGYYIKDYLKASEDEKKLLLPKHWEVLVQAVGNALRSQPLEGEDYFKQHDTIGLTPVKVPAEFDIMALVADMHAHGVDPRTLQRPVKTLLGVTIVNAYGPEEATKRLQQLAPGYEDVLANIVTTRDSRVHTPGEVDGLPMSVPETAPTAHIRLDAQVSRFVDEWYTRGTKDVTAQHGYQRFKAGAEMGVYPRPEVIGRLIAAMGRAGALDKLHELYQSAQLVLAAMEGEKSSQSLGWFLVEDQMIVGLAHAGEVEAAHVHRLRILEQNGSPSADAYGALIENVTDTTDDTTNALALFDECRARGVTPNIYLYNTVISKLAKARKADHAIQLFHQMQAEHIRPTSVTYGALIAACCRVGDAISAETLFAEMTAQKNFKPRIPPYNTMMQLYTHTKPDRERVLHYFNEMRRVGVKPTAHTYKLLMDAYGTIEPIDTDAMQQAFDTLVADPQVAVQGTHWAALINAWGCAKKDLKQAIAIFESIPTHPSTSRKANGRLPDAVVFEALINVFVTLRCPELIAQYRARIPELGIRMTAYIANLLIKGYAAAGDIAEARNIFESLSDPPEGVAAPFNHAPHGDQPSSPSNHLNLPDGTVYREPSTWEAMVRAELGHGNRDEALALLERVRARRFPPAVYHRISGIMLDDSVSPWGRGSEASAPSTP